MKRSSFSPGPLLGYNQPRVVSIKVVNSNNQGGVMKRSRRTMMVFLALSFILSFSPALFADNVQLAGNVPAVQIQPRKFVKLLNKSAKVLQTSHPDLAAGLSKYAGEVNDRLEGKENPLNAGKEIAGRLETRIKILRDAARALHRRHPDLAQDLTKIAEEKAKTFEKRKGGG